MNLARVMVWFCFVLPLLAARPACAQPDAALPIQVQADQVLVGLKTEEATFRGNVTIQQGALKLAADQVTLRKVPGQNNPNITARKNVVIHHGADVVTGENATYRPNTQQIVVTGKVTAQRGNSTLRGETLTYDVRDATFALETGRAKQNGQSQGDQAQTDQAQTGANAPQVQGTLNPADLQN